MKGLEVKEIRLENGLSQTEFANSLGVSLRTIQNWESKENNISKKIELLIKDKYAKNTQYKICENNVEVKEQKEIFNTQVSELDKFDNLSIEDKLRAIFINTLNLKKEIKENKKTIEGEEMKNFKRDNRHLKDIMEINKKLNKMI